MRYSRQVPGADMVHAPDKAVGKGVKKAVGKERNHGMGDWIQI